MKEPVKRLKLTIAAAVIFVILYAVVILFIEQRQYNDLMMKDSVEKTEAVRSMIEGYKKNADEVGRGFCEERNAEVKLMTIRLADKVVNGEFSGERSGDSSMVVCVRNGKVELPPEAEGLFSELTPQMITNEYAQTGTVLNAGTAGAEKGWGTRQREVLLTSGRIAGDWYYVIWTPGDAYREYITSRLSEEKLLDSQKYDKDTEIFVIPTTNPSADAVKILYKTDGLSTYDTLEDLGITSKDLEADSFTIKPDKGKKYLCIPIEVDIVGHTFVCCNSVEGVKAEFIGDNITLIVLAAAMLAGLITWCFSVQWLVGREANDEDRKQRYRPEAVKKRTTRLTIMSTAVVTFFSFLTVMMQYMYQEDRIGINLLTLLQTQVEDAEKNDYDASVPETERYVRLGKTVSAMLTENPALVQRDKLAGIAEAIRAEYIVVYDENGNETACSRSYIGFDLPADQKDVFSDFRRLTKGIDVITHEPEKDFITGQMRPFVGIRYDYPENALTGTERFGAVLIALPASVSSEEIEEGNEDIVQQAKQQVYRSIQAEERMILEIDPQTHRILSGSRNVYTGSDIEGLGIDPDKLKDRHMGFYHFDGDWYFGVTKASENALYQFLTRSSPMSRGGLLFALISGGLFLICYTLMSQFALKDYTEENYERYAPEISRAGDGYLEKLAKKGPSLGSMAAAWRNMVPEEKTKAVLQFETGVMMVVLVLIAIGDSPFSKHSALSFVMRGNWSKEFNLFSVIAVSVTCCIGYLVFLVMRAVFGVLYHLADHEGDTVLGLIQSFLNYILFIGTVCMSLSYFGIDTVTLLASLGIFSLAISLGAKDVVTDILAGVSIILEKTFTVGDVIQIGDFKGKVVEIGVRSTKVESGTHEVKTINNHEIANVINYSRKNLVCAARFVVPVTVSFDEMKAMFERELPKVREINPHITRGPKFDGIVEFNDDNMTISVSAEGPEAYIYGIRIDLNRMLQSLAERGLLELAQQNIAITTLSTQEENTDSMA